MMVLFVNAAAGVKVGPEVMVNEPAKIGVEKIKKAIHTTRNREFGLFVVMTLILLRMTIWSSQTNLTNPNPIDT